MPDTKIRTFPAGPGFHGENEHEEPRGPLGVDHSPGLCGHVQAANEWLVPLRWLP